MKKALVILMALALVAGFSSVSLAAGIAGTDHDLSAKGYGSTEICIFCHAPHNPTDGSAGPLWNHDVTAVDPFTLYSSSTIDATLGQPTGVSKLCLSCHDGTVAVDSYGGNAGTNFMAAGATVGTDLSDDHPVSFLYDGALATADGELATPNSVDWVDAGQTLPLFEGTGQLECGTCHDVHDSAGISKFLRADNTGSALCLTCHAK